MTRDAQIAGFLRRHGFDPADAEPLAQDASFRRYLRLRGARPAVLMDAPPPEDVRPFLSIAAVVADAALPARLDVIVPAEKLPEKSRITKVPGVLALCAAFAALAPLATLTAD